jgi:zinc transport system substrate-binding protein
VKYKLILFSVLFVSIFYTGCSKNEQVEDGRTSVFTSILPQKYFVERIGGDKVSVNVLVKPGKSPATYEPTPSQVIALSSADIFFNIGVAFENGFLDSIKSNLKNTIIVDSSAGVIKRKIKNHFHDSDLSKDEHDDHDEDNHTSHKNTGEGSDPHTWLSVSAVKIHAENIYKTLSEADPENSDLYKNNLNEFVEELDKTGNEIKKMLSPYRGKGFYVFHPSFGYFADEYGLKQIAIETGGKEPSPASLEKIITEAIEEGIKVIIAQPEFSKKSAEVIADAIGGEIVILNPLEGDYLNNLKVIASGIMRALE